MIILRQKSLFDMHTVPLNGIHGTGFLSLDTLMGIDDGTRIKIESHA